MCLLPYSTSMTLFRGGATLLDYDCGCSIRVCGGSAGFLFRVHALTGMHAGFVTRIGNKHWFIRRRE